MAFRMPSPNARPPTIPNAPTTIPCEANTRTICHTSAPTAFMMPISRVFCTVTVMSVFITQNPATTSTTERITNIVERSVRTASKNCALSSIHVSA